MISLEEAYELSSEEVNQLLKKYVSPELQNLFSFFSFSKDIPKFSKGSYITLSDGREILDITGGIGVLNHGHNHEEILAARISYQKRNRMEVHKNYLSQLYVALASNIAEISPGDLKICFFPSSGSESVEGALKMAFKRVNPDDSNQERNILLRSSQSFHGKLFGAGAATASPELNYKFPKPFKTIDFERDNQKSFLNAIEKSKKGGESKAFAIIYEPFSASLCEDSSIEFLKLLREEANKEEITLIIDEVYSGFFKTGPLFNFMYSEIIPDIVTFGKSFGGGKSSISGYISKESIFKSAYGKSKYATLHSTTYSGLGEEAATAIKSLEIAIRDNYEEKALNLDKQISNILLPLCNKSTLIKSVSGKGALWAIEVELLPVMKIFFLDKIDKRICEKILIALIIEKLYTEHNILSFFGSNTSIKLIISMPLIAEKKELDQLSKALKSIFLDPKGIKRFAIKKGYKFLIDKIF